MSLTRLIDEKSGGGDGERVEGVGDGSDGSGEGEWAVLRFAREVLALETSEDTG